MWSEKAANGTRMGQYLTAIEKYFLKKVFEKSTWPKKILDIGGGDGRFGWFSIKNGADFHIILEFDKVPILDLLDSGWDLPVLIGNGNQVPIQYDSFDAVFAIEVPACTDREHIKGFLEQVHKVLIKDGTLILTTDNLFSWGGLKKIISPANYKFGTYGYYTQTYLETLACIRTSGFETISSFGFRWPPFSRTSNSRWIPAMMKVEDIFRLNSLPSVSPWIFWYLKKNN
jgi:SAM-dependent methyltransferase